MEVIAPLSDTPQVESTVVGKEVVTQDKSLEIVADLPVAEGEGEKETWDKVGFDGSSYSWTDDKDDEGAHREEEGEVNNEGQKVHEKTQSTKVKKSENEGELGEENEGEVEEQIGDQVGDSEEEENESGGEDDSESEGNKDKKESES